MSIVFFEFLNFFLLIIRVKINAMPLSIALIVNQLVNNKKKFKTLILLLKIYFLFKNFTFNTGTKPTEKSPKRFKKTYSGACIRVLNSNFWQKYFHKSGSLLHKVPPTDVPEKKNLDCVRGTTSGVFRYIVFNFI